MRTTARPGATAVDQFGNEISDVALTWSAAGAGGSVVEVQVFNRGLSGGEVQDIFDEGRPKEPFAVTVAASYRGSDQTTAATVGVLDPLLLWDFTDGTLGWQWYDHLASVESPRSGLEFRSVGDDPLLFSPVVFYPEGRTLRVTLRIKSTADASGQVFHGPPSEFTGQTQRRFTVTPDGEWHECVLEVPPQEPGTVPRVDPASWLGEITVAWISVDACIRAVPR